MSWLAAAVVWVGAGGTKLFEAISEREMECNISRLSGTGDVSKSDSSAPNYSTVEMHDKQPGDEL